MADDFSGDDSIAKILLVTADLSAAKLIVRALKSLNSTSRHGPMTIAIIPALYDGSISLDHLGDFQCLITDRTQRKQDPDTEIFGTVKLDDLLWDARRQGLHTIETFHPSTANKPLSQQDAEVIAKMVLLSLRNAQARVA